MIRTLTARRPPGHPDRPSAAIVGLARSVARRLRVDVIGQDAFDQPEPERVLGYVGWIVALRGPQSAGSSGTLRHRSCTRGDSPECDRAATQERDSTNCNAHQFPATLGCSPVHSQLFLGVILLAGWLVRVLAEMSRARGHMPYEWRFCRPFGCSGPGRNNTGAALNTCPTGTLVNSRPASHRSAPVIPMAGQLGPTPASAKCGLLSSCRPPNP
jgi:hypothetical protein